MKVKFKNTEVDIWKLRKGTVVTYNDKSYHLKHLGCSWAGTMSLTIEDSSGIVCVQSLSCEWLEPH